MFSILLFIVFIIVIYLIFKNITKSVQEIVGGKKKVTVNSLFDTLFITTSVIILFLIYISFYSIPCGPINSTNCRYGDFILKFIVYPIPGIFFLILIGSIRKLPRTISVLLFTVIIGIEIYLLILSNNLYTNSISEVKKLDNQNILYKQLNSNSYPEYNINNQRKLDTGLHIGE